MGTLNTIFDQIFPASHPAIVLAPRSKPAQPRTEVDVTAILNAKTRESGQPLSWRSSIVDFLKVLHLDSSLPSRQALARELYYSGDTNNSAAMNAWLQRQVMTKLAQNGGKVPAELTD